jgi:TonB family protein
VSARTALGAPLALSLAGHAVVIAAVAGAGYLAGPVAATAPETVRPVARAANERDRSPAPRYLLLDTGDSPSPAPPLSEDSAVPLDTGDPRYRPYLVGVKERIWRLWSAPSLPAGAAARGVLVVEFTLTRSGRLAASAVRETSGVPALDRAALDAVVRAFPFAPLPASIAGESLRVRARFVYD